VALAAPVAGVPHSLEGRMGERRETIGLNWNAREPVGVRAPRTKRHTQHDEKFESLEDELRKIERDLKKPSE
jgi:hypothetical protein